MFCATFLLGSMLAALAGAPSASTPFDDPSAWSLPEAGVSWHTGEAPSGGSSLRFERTADSSGRATVASRRIPITVQGRTLELRGRVRAADLDGRGGIWLKTYAQGGQLISESVLEPIDGDWQNQRIRTPLDPRVASVEVGGALFGTGAMWLEALELRVDRKPLERAKPRPPSGYWDDHRFDGGSGVEVESLTPTQIEHLVLLGEVWGFLKYHHPVVTSGQRQWDYSLFEVLPAVLDAPDAATARGVITEFAERLGEPPPCRRCAELSENVQLAPELDWIRDEARLGAPLSQLLQQVYDRRPALLEQTYARSIRGIGGASFVTERRYADLELPDAGYRILAAYRFWNIVQYWSPYRDLPDVPWSSVLARTLPMLVEAQTSDEYTLALVRLVGHIDDSHTNLWGSLEPVPPAGDARLPVQVRLLDGQAVVWEAMPESPLLPGDVLVSLDGEPIDALVERIQPYYPGSNPPARARNLARSLTFGSPGPVEVEVIRAGEPRTVEATRVGWREVKLSWGRHDRTGETIQVLGERTAYVKLSSVKRDGVASVREAAAQHGGLVIDLRNYPSAMFRELAQHLIEEPTPTVRFTRCDIDNPGAFVWNEPNVLEPLEPFLDIPVAVLVDEVTQSSAELHAITFQAGPQVRIFGSTTAGADGNVSPIPLPGGHQTKLSSIGVFLADDTPTQRVGVPIDHEVRPTVDGIREGRDEVLEDALRWIWGDAAPEAEVVEAARRLPAP